MERENLDDETNNINSDTNSDPQKDSIEEYYVTRSINSDSIASSHRLCSSESNLSQLRAFYPYEGSLVDITAMKRENKKLKADLFELKAKYYLLKQEMPFICNANGADISENYAKFHAEFSKEKEKRLNLEAELNELSKKFISLTTAQKKEKLEWNEEKMAILEERNELRQQVKNLNQELYSKALNALHYSMDSEKLKESSIVDFSEDCVKSSLSDISIISEDHRQLTENYSSLLRKLFDTEKENSKFQEQINFLNNKLNVQSMELSAKTKELQNEIKKNEILNDELLTFKANLEEKFIRNEPNEERVESKESIDEERLQKSEKAVNALSETLGIKRKAPIMKLKLDSICDKEVDEKLKVFDLCDCAD
ncbi:unnamed protein product, partial [Dracunculus medinensis]|uniref:DUF4515 domain-containing protein n=1 Tax=Dracunculus medinensis TaxID=318479 RepID=A0A0N4UHT1_DRAME